MSTTNPVPTQEKLIKSIKVEPAKAQPGQPVLVEVCDASGKPISDPDVSIVIQGVPGNSRYFQFPKAGTINLLVSAVQGTVQDTQMATVTIEGAPLTFRSTLATPNVQELSIVHMSAIPGQPYAAAFRLGNGPLVKEALVSEMDLSKKAASSESKAKPQVTKAVVPTEAMAVNFAGLLKTTPSKGIERAVAGPATASAETKAIIAPVFPGGGVGKIPPEATSYEWDFGDGTKLTTQSPHATHDYSASIEAGDITRSFNVSCTAVHDGVSVKRTLVLHSAYGLCKRMGVIVPRLTGDTYASLHKIAFSGALTVHNLESTPITLDSMACVPLSDSEGFTPEAPKFTKMQEKVTVAPHSASAVGVNIPVHDLQVAKTQITSFAVYYSGTLQADGKTVPVRFSYVFRIRLQDQWILHSLSLPEIPGKIWNGGTVKQAIGDIVNHRPIAISQPGKQLFDPATKTMAIALTKDATHPSTQAHARTALRAGIESAVKELGPVSFKGRPVSEPGKSADHAPAVHTLGYTYNPLSPPPVALGNECYPDDISDADAATAKADQLVCQATPKIKTVTVPAAFQNALKGDVILSPVPVGSGDLIAALFKALNPPQHHGHSGIMTGNFYEITHCTASTDRIKKNVIKDSVGIPTSLNPEMLQYAWPGSITQSVDDATMSLSYVDPDNKAYSFQSFNTDREGEGYEIIPPLVIKPMPEHEAEARPKLRQAADIARSKGARYDSSGHLESQGGCYYSFYCYTDPQESAGFTDPAGADAGWAQGKSPAVCSSFVWMCLKESGAPLVTTNKYEKLSDFTSLAQEAGARVGPKTLDGLVFYPEAERAAAAEGLRQLFLEQALSQEFGLGTIPGINDAVAGRLADQLLNTFAFGKSDMVGSDAWKHPGDGNAVSPDNIEFWKIPYYGWAEPLQYLPKHPEQYRVSRWELKPGASGTITGKVTCNGKPVNHAHVWVYLPGGDTYTAADGSYTLKDIPLGSYSLKAQATITENGIKEEFTNGANGEYISLTAADAQVDQNIVLHGNPAAFRHAEIQYHITCDHGDDNPFNTHGVKHAGPYTRSIDVNPGVVKNTLSYTYDYAGGGYFRITYVFTVSLLLDYSLSVTLDATMYDDGSNSVQKKNSLPPFIVPMGKSYTGMLPIEQSQIGYHNGPAEFYFTVTNSQQTG